MSRRLLISVALLSAALIAFQLVLMQILALTQWYHFAYMVISVALLGFGVSGSILAVGRQWLLARAENLLPLLMILCGASMVLILPLTQTWLGGFDMVLLFMDRAQIGLLASTCLVYLMPFALGALAIGLVMVQHVTRVGTVYFANLTGSGLGGILVLGCLWYFFPAQLPGIVALFPIAAGLLLLPQRCRVGLGGLALGSSVLAVYFIFWPVALVPSEYKSISRTLNLPEAVIEAERISPHGLVQVVAAEGLRHAPGLSLAYRGEIPTHKAVFNNGEWFGAQVPWSHRDTSHIMDYTTTALPFQTGARHTVLVLNAATGVDVAHALTHGARQVTAVEPNRPAVELMRQVSRDDQEVAYNHPAVTRRMLEPRTYLKLSSTHYDLITLPTLDAFGGTAGLYALQEQYLLTAEAFSEMWRRLAPGGVISVTAWMDYPLRNPLKMLVTLVELLEREGVESIADHLVVIRSWGTVSFFAHRTPIDASVIAAARAFCRDRYFDPVLLPDLQEGERTAFNDIQDRRFFEYVDTILTPARHTLLAEYPFYLYPATDNRPYFSQFLRWSSLSQIEARFGRQSLPFLELGYLMVAVTLVQITLAALLLIILPLFKLGFRGSGKLRTVIYFSGLGIGFMFVEIVLIQHFILYLGHPLYAAAAVITALLICSGAGSLVSSQFPAEKRVLQRAAAIVALLTLVYIPLLPVLLDLTMGLPLVAKGLLALGIIAPPAFCMGMPFPLGLRHIALHNAPHVPWALGINGCTSVVSAVLATLLAVEFGFGAVMLAAVGAYGMAGVAFK